MSKHWDTGYTCLPNNFGDDVKKDSHLRVLFKIMTFHYCDEKRLSNSYLMKITGKSSNTVIEAMAELERLGYVKNISRGNHSSSAIYKVVLVFGVARKPISKNEIGGISKNEIGGISKNENKELNIKIIKHKEREKDKKPESEVDKIIKKWNGEKTLPSFESNTNIEMKIGKKLIELERDGIYPLDVINAISNFSDLKGSPNTWFKGSYSLLSFLGVNGRKEQLTKFLVENFFKEEYLNEQESSTLSNEQKEEFKKMEENKKINAEQAAIDIAELTALIEGGDYE